MTENQDSSVINDFSEQEKQEMDITKVNLLKLLHLSLIIYQLRKISIFPLKKIKEKIVKLYLIDLFINI